MPDPDVPEVSAVVLAFSRLEEVGIVVDRLQALDEVGEVLVVDVGDGSISALVDQRGGKARAVRGDSLGAAARTTGAREARGRYVLMLDDDSYPLAGAVDRLRSTLEARPETGV